MLEDHVRQKIQHELVDRFQLPDALQTADFEFKTKSVRNIALAHTPKILKRYFNPDGKEFFQLSDISGHNIKIDKIYFDNNHTKLYRVIENNEVVLWKIDTGMNTLERKEEAIIQSIVKVTLDTYGYSSAVPRIHSSYIHPEWGYILSMEAIPNAVLASRFLAESLDFQTSSVKNDIIVLEIIIQLAIYLEILQKNLGFLHGDLKSNNILLIDPLPSKRVICSQIGSKSYKLAIKNQVILIDYGFSSLGNSTDTYGTDIFLYLATLWKVGQFRNCLSPGLKGLFRKWLTFKQNEWWKTLEANMETPEFKFTHLQTVRKDFIAENSRPSVLLEDIQKAYPSLLENIS